LEAQIRGGPKGCENADPESVLNFKRKVKGQRGEDYTKEVPQKKRCAQENLGTRMKGESRNLRPLDNLGFYRRNFKGRDTNLLVMVGRW